ncbi:Eukaryotic initiation factor 4A-III [Linnemannia zychae]|nr:Eukaryotic initiation factor 4A-III [Linnemannia zychae]
MSESLEAVSISGAPTTIPTPVGSGTPSKSTSAPAPTMTSKQDPPPPSSTPTPPTDNKPPSQTEPSTSPTALNATSTTTSATKSSTRSSPREPKNTGNATGSLPGSPKPGRSKKSQNASSASAASRGSNQAQTQAQGHENENGIRSTKNAGETPSGATTATTTPTATANKTTSNGENQKEASLATEAAAESSTVGTSDSTGDKVKRTTSSSSSQSYHKGGGRWEGNGPNSNSTRPAPASTSEARFANSRPPGGNYRNQGGEEDSGRGRKFDKRGPRPHQSPATIIESTKASSPSPTTTTEQSSAGKERGSQQRLESPGISDAKKSLQATRSPRSPRSPRRGFGERGPVSATAAESKGTNINSASADSQEKNDTTEAGESPSGKPKDGETGSQAVGGTTSTKKRKPNKKNRKKDDDEESIVSHSSTTKEGGDEASSMDAKESDDKSNATMRKQQQQPHVGSNDSSTFKDITTKEGVLQSGSNAGAWVPKSKSTRPYPQSSASDNSNTCPPFNKNNGPRESSSFGRNDSGTSTWHASKNSYLGQRNGPDGRRSYHSDRGSREPSASDSSNNWNSGKSRPASTSKKPWIDNQDGQRESMTKAGKDSSEVKANWDDTSSTTQKDKPETQRGWGDAPSDAQPDKGWDVTPLIENNDWQNKASEKNDEWTKTAENKDSWSRSVAKSQGWDKTSEKNSNWDRASSRSQGWDGNSAKNENWNKTSAKGRGKSRPEAPATHQIDKQNDSPAAAVAAGQERKQDQTASTQNKQQEDSKVDVPHEEKKEASSTAPEIGWGEAPSATGNGNGWNVERPTSKTTPWDGSVPWESSDTLSDAKPSKWGESADTSSQKQESTSNTFVNDHQRRPGTGRGRPIEGSEARFAASQKGYQRGGGSFHEGRGDRKFQDSDSTRSEQSFSSRSQLPKDARSSLDARNERLGIARGQRSRDNRDEQRGESSEKIINPSTRDSGDKDSASGLGEKKYSHDSRRPIKSGSSDGRLDSRASGTRSAQRSGGSSGQFEPRDQANERFQRKPPTKGSSDKIGQGRVGTKQRELNVKHMPMFSNSLECQMTWEEMGLRPEVLSKIIKAGLKKPSNIQKLVMKPFKEGKDVIAQTQSQKDRTNTLAIALLEKLSSKAHTHKYPQAVVICSDGINPQRVHEDIQDWFEGISGLSSIYLTTEDLNSEESVLSDQERDKQVVVTTLGPLMGVLRKNLVDMKFVETVVISMRADELVNFDAFKQFWAMMPREAQVVLMTGRILPPIQMIRNQNFRANTAVRRADELTLQWSEHYYINIPQVTTSEDHEEDVVKDHKWEALMQILSKNPEISHTVILTQSQSMTQALTAKLEQQKLPVLSVWSMADKTEVAKQFNQPERCILVSESLLMDSLDLDHSSLVINYEMPKRAQHYISSFGPFGRSGLRTLMINLCIKEDPIQQSTLELMESMYNINIQEMQLE